MIKLFIGTDHNGVEYKKELMKILDREFEIVDCSPINTPTDDYPDFAFKTGKLVVENPGSFGVLICGTGVGISIAANKVDGVRCALVTSDRVSRLARYDDDANIIALDSIIPVQEGAEMIKIFVSTPVKTEEKYHRRIKKILDYERGEYNEL